MDFIEVQGARQNNLKNISLKIPKHKLTVFTGLSGSGKSSLVFDTIAQESQRLINETYPAFIQGFMPSYERPDVDVLKGLSCSVVIDQGSMGKNPRSTVGTTTDAAALLRTLFSKIAEPNLGGSDAYSFNVPSAEGGGAITKGGKKIVKHFKIVGGMCLECQGRGIVASVNLDELLDFNLSLREGAILAPGFNKDGWQAKVYIESGLVDPDKKLKDMTEAELGELLYKEPCKVKVAGINMSYEGLVNKLKNSMFSKELSSLQPHIQAFVKKAAPYVSCPSCHGTRLAQHTLESYVTGADGVKKNIAELSDMEVSDLAAWLKALRESGQHNELEPLLLQLEKICTAMERLGIGYLQLSRSTASLSGGESQRVKMIRQLSSALSDICYVFDEPSSGMHPHDIHLMNEILLELRDKGNTVLVVEHKPEVIAIADHVVDLGPGAEKEGGTICFEGSFAELKEADTHTARSLFSRIELNTRPRKTKGHIHLEHANSHNLKDVSVDVPLGQFVVIAGVAGSGKSSLISEHLLPACATANFIDQSEIKGNRRSSPATYTSMADTIRKSFAKATGQKAGLFSANSEGTCPACKGSGIIETQLGYTETVTTSCSLCDGTGFSDEALEHKVAGTNIAEVMALTAEAAVDFFSKDQLNCPAAKKIAQRLVDVGLGYLSLGQSLTTLSGGERQRLKLATLIDNAADTLILDEPTAGLHLHDVDRLITLFNKLVDAGKNVIVIEHNLKVVAAADHVIELGPGAGSQGGKIVFEGSPQELLEANTLTATHLANYLKH